MSVVNTGCAFPALTLPNGSERKPGGDTSLALRKNNDAITLLQEGSLLNLAVLLSSYGSLKSLVSRDSLSSPGLKRLRHLIKYSYTF